MSGRPFLALAAVFLIGLSLTACQPQTRAKCPVGERCLEYGNTADPNTLDPQLSQTTNESAILRELFQGLYADAADGTPAPGLAASAQTSADGLTWTFKLRPARWSDGIPVTAGDFVYAYRRILDPATGSAYAYLLYVLKNAQEANNKQASLDSIGVRALDDETLQLTLAHPASYLPQLLKHQAFFPVPEHVVRRWGDRWVSPTHYVSNGPYVLRDWRLGDYVRIEKNRDFDGADKLCFDRVNFYPTPDSVSAERQVLRGELDLNDGIAANRVPHLRANPANAPFVRTHTFLETSYLAYNTRDVPALKDVHVRQAISMAIDREFITSKLMRAGQRPTTAFVPLDMAGYLPKAVPHPQAYWASWPLAQRQAEARRLLTAAGYTLAHPLRLEFKTVIAQSTPASAQSIQSDLKSVGVDLTFRQEDGVLVYESLNLRDFQIAGAAWVADYNDPMTFLALLKSDTGAQNYGDFNNPKYDAALKAADEEPDAAKRAQILAGAEQMILDDANVAPLYNNVNTNLVSPRITGWVDNESDIHPIRFLCRK